MLLNHRCFRAYLHRFKHKETLHCPVWRGTPEHAEHAFSHYSRYDKEKRKLGTRLASSPKPETLVQLMIESDENWNSVATLARSVMTKLRPEEMKSEKNELACVTAPRRQQTEFTYSGR
uniref:Uncharacterized protein n=1 Tax=Bracon brevicornis TaxID=1563983 RepID=A0A6V7M0U4_9HYME